ncbi:MAG: zinc ribbon domain-containing protein [Actinobacteria bacterium]|nr:zinc ribbon domain-containing protein [Actinomycetota bacterium]
MASYDLTCRSCGKDFEVFVLGFLKEEAKVCPDCGSTDVEQRFTKFGGVMGSSQSWSGGGGAASCRPSSGFS